MIYAFADTETTGFAKSGDLVQKDQARVCQVACILCDEEGKHLAEMVTLIKLPASVVMSEGAQKIHGFSWADCHSSGMSGEIAFRAVFDMISRADKVCFHNEKFDARMLQIEAAYQMIKFPDTETYCTMLASTYICDLTGNYGKPKWPKLAEALPILCGKELGDDAHDAMVDARGCKDLFFELKRRGLA